jgi:hypothetical protein
MALRREARSVFLPAMQLKAREFSVAVEMIDRANTTAIIEMPASTYRCSECVSLVESFYVLWLIHHNALRTVSCRNQRRIHSSRWT